MAKIKLLDKSVYNKIAAGEVVERPASIVKELVENSLDAGATEISVEIENGGIEKISVLDNGCGIAKEDLINAFLPHATSKIEKAQDLFNLSTLGFRGEALASISAVSRVSLISMTEGASTANKITINGGEFGEIKEVAGKCGTSIVVKNIFYNIPVRAKFLKKPKQEENEITNYIEKMMLSRPNICFKYIVDGKIIYNTRDCELKNIIYTIYGSEVVENLLEVNYKKDDYEITGYIIKPENSKPNRTYQTLFVNNRYVQNFMVSSAIQNAYDDFLMKGKFPLYVLYLNLPLNSVDVNIHPNKLEVKFENLQLIYGLFNTAVYNALIDSSHNLQNVKINEQIINKITVNDFVEYNANNNNNMPSIESNINVLSELKNTTNVSEVDSNKKPSFFDFENSLISPVLSEIVLNTNNSSSESTVVQKKLEINTEIEDQLSLKESLKNWKKIGTLFSTYILIECESKFVIIDQHAAHERLLYDKLMNQVNSNSLTVQSLLIPYIFNVNAKENSFIMESQHILNEFGINIDIFGQSTFKITQVPYILSDINLKAYIEDFLSDSEKISKKPLSYIKEYFTQKACKAAVKAGMILSDSEIDVLINSFINGNNVLKCPHGRPVVIALTKNEIEKLFKRIV